MYPFTATYPRHRREDAILALKAIPKDAYVLDTETTGIKKTDSLTEIAIVSLKNKQDRFSSKLLPPNIDAYKGSKAEEVSGIVASELVSAPTLVEVWPKISGKLTVHHILAFNADFDMRLIRSDIRKQIGLNITLHATCIMKLCMVLYGLDFYPSLGEACHLAGIDQSKHGQAHTALADTLAERELLQHMMKETK